jgi:hypothetical protein
MKERIGFRIGTVDGQVANEIEGQFARSEAR